MVPHLVTALTGPINELEQRMLDAMPAIERWFRLEWMEHTPPFYTAVDVRNAGFKLAPLNTSLFPSAWNNLSPDMLPLAVQAAMASIEKICPEARNLLIISDNAIRNTFYLSNLAQLQQIFHMAGLNVRIGSISPELKNNTSIDLPDGRTVTIEPVLRTNGRIGVEHFDPCTILLNNDLHAGVPGILEDLYQQHLLPPLHAGWTTRRKSNHYKSYEEVAKRFGKLIGVDPWLVNPLLDKALGVSVYADQGIETLTDAADVMLGKIKRRYKEYGIKEKPFVVLKADVGRNGIACMAVRDAKEVALLVHKQREKTGVLQELQDVLIQEGVMTHERMNDAVAEPVVYVMDRYVVGGFYRVHAEPGRDEDCSAPGSTYVPLAFAETTRLPQPGIRPGVSAPNRFYMYGVIARLATLAASYELEATDPDAERLD
jgi:glutamate--cysteine ligase